MAAERVFVTGGAGFIGSSLVRRLLESAPDTQVLTYDLLTYAGHLQNLEDLPGAERHRFVQGDIAEPDQVAEAFASFEPTCVVNVAAETHVDQSLHEPARFVRTNVAGTQVLLDACRKRGIRMLQVSTDEVYGSLPEPQSAKPGDPLVASSPYSASKAAADLLVLAAMKSHSQDVVITRCTNNYGPRQMPEKVVPLMTLRALAGETLPVYGDGLQERDWIHVDDHARGIAVALRRGRSGGIYHFAGRTTLPNLELVRSLLELTGAADSQVEHVKDRPAHDRRYALDDQATRDELGWAPEVTFEEGLASTVRWYRENTPWCMAVAGESFRAFLEKNYTHR